MGPSLTGGRGNLGNARKKTFFFSAGVPLLYSPRSQVLIINIIIIIIIIKVRVGAKEGRSDLRSRCGELVENLWSPNQWSAAIHKLTTTKLDECIKGGKEFFLEALATMPL